MRDKRSLISVLLSVSIIMSFVGCQVVMKPPAIEKPAEIQKPSEEKVPVIIKRIESKRELPIGYWVEGRLGDFLIENDKIKVVVTDLQRSTEFSEVGGNIIDLAKKSDNLDYFGGIFFDGFKYTLTGYETRLPDEEHKEGVLRLLGHAADDSNLAITQEYRVEPDKNIIKVVTIIENKATESREIELKDKVVWGGGMLFIGRHGSPSPTERVETECDWLCGRVENYSVGLTVEKGMLKTSNLRNISDITYRKVNIAPGSKETLERYLYVGDRDISRITGFMIDLRKEPHSYITGTVIESGSEKPVPDVEVRVRCDRLGEQKIPAYPYTLTYSKEDGTFEIPVQAGSFFVLAHPFGRRAAKNVLSTFALAGTTQVVKLGVSKPLTLSYEIRDAETDELIPAKITFITLPGKPSLDFGTTYEAPGSNNTYYAYTGQGEIILPPQLYKIIVSRGIEYEIFEKEMAVKPGQKNELKVKLKRVLDTKGWISADIGVRTNRSYDSLVTPRDRVIAAVCEGVEWLVSGDTDEATDLQKVIDELKLNKWIKATPGLAIEFPGEKGAGNFLVFPVDPKSAEKVIAEIDTMADWEPDRLFSYLRSTFPNALIQVNDPLDPENGYFAKFGYVKEDKKLPEDKKFSYNFDLISIWRGKRLQAMQDNLELYYTLLKAGYVKGFSGGSFSHFIYGEETGYPRLYIMSSTDNPDEINEDELIKNLKTGKTLLTNGPFIEFRVNGKSYTEIVKPENEIVNCELQVFAAPWVNVNVINVNRDGSFVKWVFIPPIEQIKRYPRRKEGPDEFKLSAKEESFLNITVKGSQSMDPVVSQLSYPEGVPMTPFAISAPIFVDANGNNKYDP